MDALAGLADYLWARASLLDVHAPTLEVRASVQTLRDWAAAVQTARGVALPAPTVAWEYANSHGDKFLTHSDPSKWHDRDRNGFKDFKPLVYAAGVPGV